MKILEIDLKKIPLEHKESLRIFFRNQINWGIFHWDSNKKYHFENGIVFKLTHRILARKNNNQGYHFEILSHKNPIGKGGFGNVYRIRGQVSTLGYDDFSIFKKLKKDGGRRVIKRQNYSFRLDKEYCISKKIKSLGMKSPVVSENFSYLVMNLIPGQELLGFLADKTNPLTVEEKLKLTHLLLHTLKKIKDHDIIHKDIKPENIVVDMVRNSSGTHPAIKAEIIDFGSSCMSYDDTRGYLSGTPAYMAPELLQNNRQRNDISNKIDVYSMARVIALIWDVDYELYSHNHDYFRSAEYFSTPAEAKLFDLFSCSTSLPLKQQAIIRTLLEKMLALDPKERLNIDEAIHLFQTVYVVRAQSLIKQLIDRLEYERKECFFSQKQLKKHKIIALNQLLTSLEGKSLTELSPIIIDYKSNYPHLTKGLFSRTEQFLNHLLTLSNESIKQASGGREEISGRRCDYQG